MQAIFVIILDAKNRHDIMNANFDERLCELEATATAPLGATCTTPFQHLQRERGAGKRETPQKQSHRIAKLSPTGAWSTRLTTPAKLAAEEDARRALEEKSLGEGLSAFDSTAVQSFLDVSHSVNLPLEALALDLGQNLDLDASVGLEGGSAGSVELEYSPDKSASASPSPATRAIDQYLRGLTPPLSDPHDEYLERHSYRDAAENSPSQSRPSLI
jgi:hypothetical protein